MNNYHDPDEDDDHEAQLRRFLDETRANLIPPNDPGNIFLKVDFPDGLLHAPDEDREQFLWAAAHRAVFDADPYWRNVDMPRYVLQELQKAGVSRAVQEWVAYVLREGDIPHSNRGRPAAMHAQSDYWHNLAVFILDHETDAKYRTKSGKIRIGALLSAAEEALAKGDSSIRSAYYNSEFQDHLEILRRQRGYLKTVKIYK